MLEFPSYDRALFIVSVTAWPGGYLPKAGDIIALKSCVV